MCKHFRKDTCILAEHVKFAMRHRKESETVTKFLIALRAIAGNCAFGASLNERLRDQLAIGINNDAWQQDLFRLHPTAEATLQQVEASALILEQASTQQQQIRSMAKVDQAAETQGVHRMKETRPSSSKRQVPYNKKELDGTVDCIRCGHSRHKKGELCPAKGSTCHACGGSNHFARVCVKSGRKMKMLYDPGASRSVINEQIWKKIGSPTLQPTVSLVAYTNVTVHTLGEAVVTVGAFGKVKKLPVIVIDQQDTPLFGLDWCMAFEIKMPNGVTVHNVKLAEGTEPKDSALMALLSEFAEIFKDNTMTTIRG